MIFGHNTVTEVVMNTEYTAIIKQDGDWWIGWIEELPGVNGQEKTRKTLLASLKVTLAEAGHGYEEEKIAIAA